MVINKKIIFGVLILVVIIAAGVYYYSAYTVKSDNAKALASLNGRIVTYGSNVRYMLANSSGYYNSFNINSSNTSNIKTVYAELVSIANIQPSIGSALALLNQTNQTLLSGAIGSALALLNQTNQTLLSGVNSTDWYMQNPSVRNVDLEALTIFGVIGYNNYTNTESMVPRDVTSLQMTYSLVITGDYVSYISLAELSLLKENYLSCFNNVQGSDTSSYFASASANNLGVGISTITETPNMVHSEVETSELNSTVYDSLSPEPSLELLQLLYMVRSSCGKGFPFVENRTAMNKIFYRFALLNYLGYYSSEMLYNRSVSPEINFIGYLNNTVIMSLGNLNTNDSILSVYIDGNKTSYNRYYDFVVMDNKHLNVGEHSVKVVTNGTSMTGGIYVSPVMPMYVMLSDTSYTENTVANLSFSIPDPYSSNLIISNISVVSGIVPSPQISPSNVSVPLFNLSRYRSSTPVLSNVWYSKLNLSSYLNSNHTGNDTYTPNFTEYKIPVNNSYQIGNNDRLILNYTVSNFNGTNNIGNLYYYTVTFDTNYGRVRSILDAEFT